MAACQRATVLAPSTECTLRQDICVAAWLHELPTPMIPPSDSTQTDAETPAVLFDMDGVLLDGRRSVPGTYERAADEAIDELGLDPDDDQRAVLRAYRCDETVQAVCRTLGTDLEQFWRLKERRASALSREQFRAGERTFQDDVSTAVAVASERPAAIVSNNRHDTVVFAAERHEIGAAVDAVRGRDPTPAGFRRRKPDPHYLIETMAELGVDAGVYVGDRAKDVLAADRAGLASVLLARPGHAEEELPEETTPRATIRSLEQLPGALERFDEPS